MFTFLLILPLDLVPSMSHLNQFYCFANRTKWSSQKENAKFKKNENMLKLSLWVSSSIGLKSPANIMSWVRVPLLLIEMTKIGKSFKWKFDLITTLRHLYKVLLDSFSFCPALVSTLVLWAPRQLGEHIWPASTRSTSIEQMTCTARL